MDRRNAAPAVAANQAQESQMTVRQSSTIAGSAPSPERHFLVPVFKTQTGKPNSSFVLGYN